METRRFRNHVLSQRLARFRWLGWVLLMMFTLVQLAQAAPITASSRSGSEQDGSAVPQTSAEFNPKTHEVTVKARVPAAAWNFTNEIGRHGLVVYEDNARQPIEDAQVAHTPLSVGVLLEDGGRYHAVNEAIAANVSRAAQELMAVLQPDDHVNIWTYGDLVQQVDIPAPSATALESEYLHLATPASSESNFYDAMLTVLPQVRQMPGRKVLIVVSSGVDTFSKADFRDVLRAAQRSGVPVCPIDIGPLLHSTLLVDSSSDQPYAAPRLQQDSARLARLAQVSGCRASAPTSSLDFPGTYDRLFANLRLEYVIRYRSTALDLPGTREVRIVWADGRRGQSRGVQSAINIGRERALADAHYTLDGETVLAAGSAPLKWSFLQLPEDSIQVPLQGPSGFSNWSSALVAATPVNGSGELAH